MALASIVEARGVVLKWNLYSSGPCFKLKATHTLFPCGLPISHVACFSCFFLGAGSGGEKAGAVFVLLLSSSSFDFFQFLSRGLCVPIAQS